MLLIGTVRQRARSVAGYDAPDMRAGHWVHATMPLIRAALCSIALGTVVVACGSTTPTQAPASVDVSSADPSAAAVLETPPATPAPPVVETPSPTAPAESAASSPAPTNTPAPTASPVLSVTPPPSTPPPTPPAADPWTSRTSKRFAYRMSYPADWAFKAGNRKYADSYYGFGGTALFASRAKNNGLTLKRLSSALTRYLPDIAGVKRFKIDHNRPAKLGPLKARRIEFNYRYKGKRYWAVGYLAVKGGNYYWVDLETTARTDAEDLALAARFAKTFRPR